jgi:hypothetical protein
MPIIRTNITAKAAAGITYSNINYKNLRKKESFCQNLKLKKKMVVNRKV